MYTVVGDPLQSKVGWVWWKMTEAKVEEKKREIECVCVCERERVRERERGGDSAASVLEATRSFEVRAKNKLPQALC